MVKMSSSPLAQAGRRARVLTLELGGDPLPPSSPGPSRRRERAGTCLLKRPKPAHDIRPDRALRLLICPRS
jgi:hypothetical protein